MSDTNQPGNTGTGTGIPASDGKPDTSTFDPSKFVSADVFNGTAAQIRRLNDTVTQISQRKALTLDELVEVGLLEKDDEGKFRARSAAPPDTKGGKKDDQLGDDHPAMKRLKALEKQLTDERAEKLTAIENNSKAERKSAVVAALSKEQALNADRDYIHLADRVVKNDAGAFVVKSKDQYGAEAEIPLEAYVKTDFLKANPELFKATAAPGSGTPRGGAGSGGGAGAVGREIPYEQWQDMNFVSANHAKFTSGEYVRGPKPGQ